MLVNRQTLLPGFAAPFDFHEFVSERCYTTVPESLQGIFVEAAPDMFCRLE